MKNQLNQNETKLSEYYFGTYKPIEISKFSFFFLPFKLLIFLSFVITSCQNTPQTDNQQKPSTVNVEKVNSCACSDADASRLAYKIQSDFERSQIQVDSDKAKSISIYGPIEKRDNCTWVATFKISDPLGTFVNPDGTTTDQFIKKRFSCDGKEVYVTQ